MKGREHKPDAETGQRRPSPEAARRGVEEAVLELQRAAGNHATGAALGSALPHQLRTEFEERLGADLVDVRIHADADADRRARAEGAAAFTRGADVYFRRGLYRPETKPGKRVIAHELAHVVQQTPSRRPAARPAALEAEADAVAQSDAAGPVLAGAPAGSVQRIESQGQEELNPYELKLWDERLEPELMANPKAWKRYADDPLYARILQRHTMARWICRKDAEFKHWVGERSDRPLPTSSKKLAPLDVEREAAERKVAEIRERLAQVTPEQRKEDERRVDEIRARQAEREGRPYERKVKEPSTFEEIYAEGRRQAAEVEAKRAAQRAQQARTVPEGTDLPEGSARESAAAGGRSVESHGEFTDDQGRPIYGPVTLRPSEVRIDVAPQESPKEPPAAKRPEPVQQEDWAKRWNRMTPEERAREMWKARTPLSEQGPPAPLLPEFYSEYQRKLDEPPEYINWLPNARYGWLGGELVMGESVSGREIDRWEKAKQIAIEGAIDIATGEVVGRLGGALKQEFKGFREVLRESPGFTPPSLGPKLPPRGPSLKPPPIAEQAAEQEAKKLLSSGEKQAAKEVAKEVPTQVAGEQQAAKDAAKEVPPQVTGERQAAKEVTKEAPAVVPEQQAVKEAPKKTAEAPPLEKKPAKTGAGKGGGKRGGGGGKRGGGGGKKGGGGKGKLPEERLTRTEERGREILRSFEQQQERAWGDVAEDVLEQPRMKGKPLPRRAKLPGTPPEQFEVGNFSHEHAEELVPRSKLPRGLDAEVVIDRGPEVSPLRADRVDWKNRVIYEVKPDTPYWRAKGEEQLKIYKGYLDKQFPGKPFKTKVVTYDYKAALKTLKKWGYLP